jgi:peptide/nickel transport system ATP-binding protein
MMLDRPITERSPGASPGLGLQPLLSVRGLCKFYPVFSKALIPRQVGLIKACDQVSFDLMPGQTLGLVGESGSGKTTTGRAILRAIRPTSGRVFFRLDQQKPAPPVPGLSGNGDGESQVGLGPVAPMVDLASLSERQLKPLRTQMQMIFQDPFSSLNPRMTVQQIVAEPLVIHRLARGRELEDRVVSILRRVGIRPEYRNRYPHAFSGGQRQRIGIARALVMRPRLIVADEAVSALDVSVQAQVINLLYELQEEFNLTYVFIAHDLSVVRHICDRVAVMYAGRIIELAETEQLFDDPQHPYTRMLLNAVPRPDPDIRMAFASGGEPADLANPPSGCAFHPRCPECFEPCGRDTPDLIPLTVNRQVACHLYKPSASAPALSA